MRKIKISGLLVSRLLMGAAIVLIATFQGYWLHKLYLEEAAGFKKTTDLVFRETLYKVQAQRLKKDSLFYKIIPDENIFLGDVAELVSKKLPEININASNNKHQQKNKMVISMNGGDFNFETNVNTNQSDSAMNENPVIVFGKEFDSVKSIGIQSGNINITRLIQQGLKIARKELEKQRIDIHSLEMPDSNIAFHVKEQPRPHPPTSRRVRDMTQNILVKSRTLNDTISIPQIDSAYKKALVNSGIQEKFTIKRDSLFRPDKIAGEEFSTSKVPIGFLSKNAYQASFEAPTAFLLRKIAPQVLLSFILVAFTLLTFLFLYRNLLAQRRLGAMKNDFISNITHELKTPIATVNVAIEALRNFNALESPERTKEYLDISAAELQRLSLLVDKVLKLSMFESKDIELQKEQFDLKELISEVMQSMRLQFEKNNASISFKTAGEPFIILADRLHLTSVIYNLFDNALKYRKGKPDIKVELASLPDEFILRVQDNGIGISQEYATKIFDKFFRVPSGDHHNIKGYGLGLSYAAQVVQKHGGTISVDTKATEGATFIIKLPSR